MKSIKNIYNITMGIICSLVLNVIAIILFLFVPFYFLILKMPIE